MRRFNWLTTIAITGLVFGRMLQVQAMAQDSAASQVQTKGFTDIIFSGGLTGLAILILLLCLSLTALYLVIDHLLTLRAKDIMPTGLGVQLRELLIAGKYREADTLCRDNPCV